MATNLYRLMQAARAARPIAHAFYFAGFMLILISRSVSAQTLPDMTPPQYAAKNEVGVDLLSGKAHYAITDVSIGSASTPLAHTFSLYTAWFGGGGSGMDQFAGGLGVAISPTNSCTTGTPLAATYGGRKEIFCQSGTTYVSSAGQGATLVNNGNGTYTYTTSKGMVILFDTTLPRSDGFGFASPTKIIEPNGLTTVLNYKFVSLPWPPNTTNANFVRIQSITRNDGFQIKYTYALNTTPTQATISSWETPTSVAAINNAVEYCSPTADTCSLINSWPTATYSLVPSALPSTPGSFTITDQNSGVTRFTISPQGAIVSVKPPTSASADTISYQYCGTDFGVVCNAVASGGASAPSSYDYMLTTTRDGQTWTYHVLWTAPALGQTIFTSTDPKGIASVVGTLANNRSPLNFITLPDGTSVGFDGTVQSNVVQLRRPDGDTKTYGYDPRGNVATITLSPKTGSPSPTLTVASAGYPATCSSQLTCNKPLWVKDGNGNQTDFTYDPTHGGILTETRAAVNGIRPQTRYTYVQRSAWYRNAAGTQVKSPTGIWLLSQQSFCRIGSPATSGIGCALANDEVITSFDYGADAGPNSLLLRGQVETADGVSHRTCFAYDAYGNKISQTTPNAALGSCP